MLFRSDFFETKHSTVCPLCVWHTVRAKQSASRAALRLVTAHHMTSEIVHLCSLAAYVHMGRTHHELHAYNKHKRAACYNTRAPCTKIQKAPTQLRLQEGAHK